MPRLPYISSRQSCEVHVDECCHDFFSTNIFFLFVVYVSFYSVACKAMLCIIVEAQLVLRFDFGFF